MTDMSKKIKITLLFSIFFILFSAFLVFFSNAQAASVPQFLVSWQASSYVPDWYRGKVFPSAGSKVSVGFDLVNNGKIVDLSKTAIRWYVNDNLIVNENNGLGIKNFTFINNDVYGGNEIDIRITLPNYNGGILDKTVAIPVKQPEVVVDAPYFGNKVSQGKNTLYAWPFFFNIKNIADLIYNWSVNGRGATDANSPFLNLNVDLSTAPGSILNLNAGIENSTNQIESANKTIQLEVK